MNLRTLLLLGAALLAAPVVLLAIQRALSVQPDGLGARHGTLTDCPGAPNCVSSTAADPVHRVDPLPMAGDVEAAMERLAGLLGSMPRTRVVSRDGPYLHAEARSRLYRFVDDLEFLADPAAGVIQIRSAARVGYMDFGVNRARVERIREAFAGQPPG